MSCFRIFFNNTLPNLYVSTFRIGFPVILFIIYLKSATIIQYTIKGRFMSR